MLTKKINRARIDCLIFFKLQAIGWGKPKGANMFNPLISNDQRLNYPGIRRVIDASRRVRLTCPDLANEYRKTYRAIRECKKRYEGTSSKDLWEEYKSKLAYDWYVAKARKVTKKEFFKLHLYAYTYAEIFKEREEERERVLKEFKTYSAIIKKLETQIFRAMEVPKQYRRNDIGLEKVKNEFRTRKNRK